MDQDHRPGLRRQHGSHRLGRQVLAVRIDIGEDRRRPDEGDGARGCDEASRRHHHLVAFADAKGEEGELKRDRAIGERDRMLSAGGGREFLFEGSADLAGPVIHLAGTQHLADGIDLLFVENRPPTP